MNCKRWLRKTAVCVNKRTTNLKLQSSGRGTVVMRLGSNTIVIPSCITTDSGKRERSSSFASLARVPLRLWPEFHIKEMFWYFKTQLNEKWIEDRCTPWGPLLKPRLLAPVEVRAKPLESLGRFNKRTLGLYLSLSSLKTLQVPVSDL